MQGDFYDGVSGMTLLEVMVALFLLSVGVLGVAAMLDVGLQSNVRANRGVQDTLTAAMLVEDILALPYDDPRLQDLDGVYDPENPDHGPVDVPGRPATVEWEVDDDFPAVNTKRLLVTVRDKRSRGKLNACRYEYLKARKLTFLPEVKSRQ